MKPLKLRSMRNLRENLRCLYDEALAYAGWREGADYREACAKLLVLREQLDDALVELDRFKSAHPAGLPSAELDGAREPGACPCCGSTHYKTLVARLQGFAGMAEGLGFEKACLGCGVVYFDRLPVEDDEASR